MPIDDARLALLGRRACLYVALVSVWAALYNIPRFWEITWVEVFDPGRNRTVAVYDPTPLRTDPAYINVYITWMYLVFMYFLPFAGLAVSNLLIYREVGLVVRPFTRQY